MIVLCCPDTLKGVLDAPVAAAALARGVERAGLQAIELPLADGGEGTADVLERALGGRWLEARVSDPLERPVTARYLVLPDGTAVIESAQAIGLARLRRDERDPMRASSRGLGELVLAALDAGVRQLIVTLGGSATVDGGAGFLAALGGRSLDGVRLRAACDVRNPLLGPRGAARVFGPQKGATAAQVAELEARLSSMVDLAPYAELPGAGAAGGLGAALAAVGATLEPGAQLVLEAVGFRQRASDAALVVTGEGAVDCTSSEGKVAGAVAAVCSGMGVPCVVFGGLVRGGLGALYRAGATSVLSLSGRPDRAARDIESLGEALARLTRQLSAPRPRPDA